jgi:integrase
MNASTLESSPEATKPSYHAVAECLYRREPSGGYYALAKRGGKQIWKSLKTKDRKLADRRLAEFLDHAAKLQPQENPHVAFDALAGQWLDARRHTIKASTAARSLRCVKAVAPFFAGLGVRNVTRRQCDEWVKQRGSRIAPQTFAHELDTMRGVFAHAVEIGLRVDNPAAHIERKPIRSKRPTVPTREQFRQLVAAIRESDGRPGSQAKAEDGANLVELLAYSGCRLEEARSLRWRDVDSERDVFTITGGERGTKNHEARTLPLNDALRQLLARLHAEASPQPSDFIVTTKSARKCLDTATRRLGLAHLTHHALRHFWATTAIESGGDIPTVAKMLGHKDGGALLMKTYGHLRQEHAFNVARKINFGTEQPANVVTFKTEANA